MPTAPTAVARPHPGRVLSIDLLRGADVLLMLFVNEVAGVKQAPAFLLHRPSDFDGMTITDLVFPAFLFIVGMATPFALGGRLRRGESRGRVWRHVLLRSLALVVMGVLMVNAEEGIAGVLSPPVWNVLMTLGVLLLWGTPDEGFGRVAARWLRRAGVALLVLVALAYRNPDVGGLVQLRPHWWGILGLIGWAYLGAATVYLLAGDRPLALTGGLALFSGVALAEAAGDQPWLGVLSPLVGPVIGTHGAIVLAGAVLGVLLRLHRREGSAPVRFAAETLGYAAVLGVAGLLLRTLHGVDRAFIISKNHATVPWGLVSSALTAGAFAILFVLVDVRGMKRWPRSLPIAGENPLISYLMAPFLLSVLALMSPLTGGRSPYEALGETTGVGLVRSAVFAWLVVRFSGWMRSRGVRIQL